MKTERAKPRKRRATTEPVTIDLVPARLKLNQILVPTDFSDNARKALLYALRFAEQFGARVTLLHVVEPVAYPAELGSSALWVPLISEEALRKDAAKKLAALSAALGRHEIKVDTLVRFGLPFHEIAAAAKELRAGLIIVSTHGYTGLKHVFLGSTAERVVRHAPCPVLTVRQHEHEFL